MGSKCCHQNRKFEFLVFENLPKFERIEGKGFPETNPKPVSIPASTEMSGENCFPHCGSLCSVTFEFASKLTRGEKQTLRETEWIDLVFPPLTEILGEDFLRNELNFLG
jgi:hypothetical protein